MHTHSCTHTLIHTHSHPHTHAHTLMHTHTHTHTLTPTHSYTHTLMQHLTVLLRLQGSSPGHLLLLASPKPSSVPTPPPWSAEPVVCLECGKMWTSLSVSHWTPSTLWVSINMINLAQVFRTIDVAKDKLLFSKMRLYSWANNRIFEYIMTSSCAHNR